jgi:hypothetical protein
LSTGGEVTVTFGGFTPFEYVQLIIASTPQVIGSGYANAQGFVTISGNLPTTLGSGDQDRLLLVALMLLIGGLLMRRRGLFKSA